MKKIFSLIFGLWSITLFSQVSIVSNPVNSGNISNTSATLSCDANLANGVVCKFYLLRRTSSDTLKITDSTTRIGTGFSNTVTVSITTTGLTPNTDNWYEWRATVSGVTIMQTNAGYSFRTLTNPGTGTISIVSILQYVGKLGVIVNYNTNGSNSLLVGVASETGYSGSGWQYTLPGKSLAGSYTNKTDTLFFNGLTSVLHTIQVRLLPNSGATMATASGSQTPLTAIGPDVTQISSVAQYDTFNAAAYVSPGNTPGQRGYFEILDSAGNFIRSTNIQNLVSGWNYFNNNGWPLSTAYGLRFIALDSLGNRDSLKTLNGWRTKSAPAVNQEVISSSVIIKATSISLGLRMWNNEYFCTTRGVYEIAPEPYGNADWKKAPVLTYTMNNSVRNIFETDLKPGTNYRIRFRDTSCSDVPGEILYGFKTLPPALPPTITDLVAYGGCGYVKLEKFSILQKSTDTSYIEVGVIIPPAVVPVIIDSFWTIGSMDYPGKTYDVGPDKNVVWVVFATSIDDSTAYKITQSKSDAVSDPTVNRAEVSKTDSSITIRVLGGTGCSNQMDVNIEVREYNSWTKIKSLDLIARKLPGLDQYDIPTVVLGPDLKPNTKYHIQVAVRNVANGNWYGAKELLVTTLPKSTSGIISGVVHDSWSENIIITAHDLSGRIVKKGIKSFLKNELPMDQFFIFTIEKDGRIIPKKSNIVSL